MRFDVTSSRSLIGRYRPPGDRLLTLSAMAFAPLCSHGDAVTIVNSSPSEDVARFADFLSHCGAGVEYGDGGIVITGGEYMGSLEIDDAVPDDVLHIVIPGAVFSGCSVVICSVGPQRRHVVECLLPMLKKFGAEDVTVDDADGTVAIGGARFVSGGEYSAGSAWSFEAVAAGAIAGKSEIEIACSQQLTSHSVALLAHFGYAAMASDMEISREAELARRLAKACGEPQPVVRRFGRFGTTVDMIEIPGDVMISSALAAIATVTGKSRLVLEGVCWEAGRRGFFETLRRMKGNVVSTPEKKRRSFDTARVEIGWARLEGVHVNAVQAAASVGELSLLGVLGAVAAGETVISDTGDGPGFGRQNFMLLADGLEMLGAHVGDYADGLIVRGGRELRGNLVDASQNQSLVLGLSVAGMCAAGKTTVFGYDENEYPVSVAREAIVRLTS